MTRCELHIEFSTLEIDNFFQVTEEKGALQTAGADLLPTLQVRDFSRSNGLTVKHESFRELMQIFIGLYKSNHLICQDIISGHSRLCFFV